MIQRLASVALLASLCWSQSSARKEITVSGEVLAEYARIYSLAPRVNVTITLADGQLTSQVTGARQSLASCRFRDAVLQ